MATVAPAYIDEEINKHLTLASNLRAEKNPYLPIFRLPPETLANIFIHGSRDYHESDDHPAFHIPRWVSVSYVCRLWRDVALNCPTLWTYHFTSSLRWTDELLARSKQASLKIHIYFDPQRDDSWWSDLVERSLTHVERIQEFRLCVPAVALPSDLSLRAPRLQILDIVGTCSRSSDSWPSRINDGDIPPFRTLKLTDCPLPWQSLNLSGLTTLFLCRVPSPSQQNILDFLATLSRMQAITVLHLEYAISSARGAFDVSSKISLPCLTRLFIIASLSTVVALLSCVNILLKTAVRLGFQREDGSSIDDYAQISRALAQRFSHSKDLSSLSSTFPFVPTDIRFVCIKA